MSVTLHQRHPDHHRHALSTPGPDRVPSLEDLKTASSISKKLNRNIHDRAADT
jgi:hypothetical protein